MTWSPSNKRAIPIEAWPEVDRTRWLETQQHGSDLLEDVLPAAKWRDSSKELFCRCYGLWLAWLASQGFLNEHDAPATRMTRDRLRAYLKYLSTRGCAAKTLINHVTGLKHMCQTLEPGEDWSWMLVAIGKLRSAVKPLRNHSDLPSIQELFELGCHLMAFAHKTEEFTIKQRAVAFRNGLAIAMLAARPFMRRANLAAIRIGENLTQEGEIFRLRFSGDEMKGRRSRGGPLPEVLTPAISRYIEVYRPVLLLGKPDNGTLFVSGMGRPIYAHAFSDRIGRITEHAFGRRITTHEFRHAAGSSIANQDPKHVGIVPTMLGHGDYRTSERYYIFAAESTAFRGLDEALNKLLSAPD